MAKVGLSKPEAKVIKEVLRPKLLELGFEEADWQPEVGVEFFPGRTGSIDILVNIGGRPLIVVEAEGTAKKFDAGFRQARAYAIFLDDPARPIPYVMVVAGKKLGFFKAEVPPGGGPGVLYAPTERILTKEEIIDAVGELDKEVPADVILLETFITLFGKVLKELLTSKRPKLDEEKALYVLADVLIAKTRGEPTEEVYKAYRIARRIQERVEELLGMYNFIKHQGRALGYAFRQFVARTFTGGPYKRYLTPAEVISFMVNVANPHPGDFIIDPVCGSGGFLGKIALSWVQSGTDVSTVIANLIGCDIDPFAVKAATTFLELLLPGAQRGLKIYHKNSLVTTQTFPWEGDLTGLLEEESFDLVIGNPPAGSLPADLWRGLQADGYHFVARSRLRQYEVAFLERALRLARTGGLVALVLPESMFASTYLRDLRQYMTENVTIELIVSLPRGVFPYTPAKMCVTLLRKEKPLPGHQTLLAEVSDRRSLGKQLEVVAQVYWQRKRL